MDAARRQDQQERKVGRNNKTFLLPENYIICRKKGNNQKLLHIFTIKASKNYLEFHSYLNNNNNLFILHLIDTQPYYLFYAFNICIGVLSTVTHSEKQLLIVQI